MKKLIVMFFLVFITKIGFAQCNIFYTTKTFTKVGYYRAINGKLELIRQTNSNNTFELLQNTSSQNGDMFAFTGNLMEKYVQFIKEWSCDTKSTKFTIYKFHTSDGHSKDTWCVTVLKDGTIYKVSNIRVSDNLVIEFY
ncbi:hypothetical protein [Ferruginibacter sp.]|nr:hypothetical protein [Ferruginibacter sp.]